MSIVRFFQCFYRILASIEHFASTANLSDANSSLIIQPHVALAIYCVSDTIRIRGIAVLTDALLHFDYGNVIPLTREMADNGNVSRVESVIVLSEEVMDLLKEMKGVRKDICKSYPHKSKILLIINVIFKAPQNNLWIHAISMLISNVCS